MTIAKPKTSLLKGIAVALQRSIRRWVWDMDIHPTAWIEPTAHIDRTYPKGVHIGAGCFIDEHAVVLAHDFTRAIYLHTRIGERCYVGPRAIVMPGLNIGDGSIIMPGAVVTKDVPPGATVVGNPAEVTVAGSPPTLLPA